MVSKETRGWDNYWKRGELHSCISTHDKENQTKINDFWLKVYSGFSDDMTVLDIGTGNGLLPSLAVSYANDKDYNWEVHGVDLADINPAQDVPSAKDILDQVNFQGRIAAEDLPFEDGYFDLVTSQYAVEYSDMTRSMAQIARVLKAGGQFCAVLHSHTSLVVIQNKENIREANFLLDSGIFGTCKELLSRILTGKYPDREVQAMVDQYVDNLARLSQTYPDPSALNTIPVMQNSLLEILKLGQKYAPQQTFEMVDNARLRLMAQRDLLRDLVGSALNETDVFNLQAQLAGLGFEVKVDQDFHIGQQKKILGYYIQAVKK